jgi:sugar phosphate isomerase/epimerase
VTVPKVVSTWSLHRTLGDFVAGDLAATRAGAALPFVGGVAGRPAAPGALPLLELPAELRERAFDAVQLVHFHLPSRDPGYLAELGAELRRHRIELDTFLLDDGDVTHETDADAQLGWMSEWISDAEILGARRVRVIAGRSRPGADSVRRSASGMLRLAREHPGVRIVFENWLEMTPDPASVLSLLERTGDEVGLLVDLANWSGPHVPEWIGEIGGRAETCHAKCRIGASPEDDAVGEQAYTAALTALRGAGFTGTLALVYDGPDPDEWGMLEREYAMLRSVFS